MDQTVVESGAMVGAGALVTPNKRVAAGELWVGAPARRVRELKPEERDMIPYLAAHYSESAAAYIAARKAAE